MDLYGETLTLYRLQPDGTWKAQAGPATGLNPSEIMAANLEGTGLMNLVVVNNLFSFASLSIYQQNPDGSFTDIRDIHPGTSISDVQVADVNHDGHPDLLVTNADSGTVTVLLNEGLPARDKSTSRTLAGGTAARDCTAPRKAMPPSI